MQNTHALLLGGLLVLPSAVSAASPDVFELGLEQLSQLQVNVASGKQDSIVDAPAIVSSYSRADLEKFGIRTLKDMLSFIPGFVRQETYIGGAAIGVRGISDGFNQKLLLLLDETPYWMTSHSDMPLLGIPFEAIDHIEVIRGPASVMYGTNASAGIVRVVTRKNEQSQLALSAGSHGLVNGGGYISKPVGEAGRLDMSFEAQRDDGYQGQYRNMIPVPAGFPNTGARDGERDREVNMTSALARYTQGGLHLALQGYRSQTDGYAFASSVANPAQNIYRGSLLYADYAWQLSQAELKVYSDYNNFYLELPTANAGGYGIDGTGKVLDPRGQYRWRSGATANYSPLPRFNLLAGVEYEKRTNQDYVLQTDIRSALLMSANETNERSMYLQGDYELGNWRLLLGGRYTSIRNSEKRQNAATPRAGVVYRLDDASSLKLLYSEGFNVPNALQLYAVSPLLSGNRDLRPEQVASTDLAYTWQRHNTLFVANGYYLRGQDFIGRRNTVPGSAQAIYYNIDSRFDRWGGELDFQQASGAWLNVANLAYQNQGNRQIAGDPTAWFTPRYTANFGSSYRLQQHRIGGALRFVDERAGVSSTTQVDLNYQYQQARYQLFVTVRNLFDQPQQQPDMLNYVPTMQADGGDGRNLLLGIRYRL